MAGAKVVTLTVADQNLLRVALDRAIEWSDIANIYGMPGSEAHAGYLKELEVTERIKDLKERLV